MTKYTLVFGVFGLLFSFASHASESCKTSHLTILGTNDIHGGIETKIDKKQNRYGGTAFFAGAVEAIKKSSTEKYGECGGVLVLDGGDQFQGTLLSNYTEGSIVFDVMNESGYDAVVPGNHDYDFGPLGWLVDKASTSKDDPREVIKSLSKKAKFTMLSANTYLKDSVTDLGGEKLEVSNVGCTPLDKTKSASFFQAIRPDFLKPYLIKEVAGLRVAVVGLDNPQTPTVTTIENVTDLCFRSALDTYLEIRKELEGKADVFVIVIHDGDGSEKSLTNLMTKIAATDRTALGITGSVLDAVVGGHTHFVNKIDVAGIPGIQSGSGGTMFGRIDLSYDRDSKTVDSDKKVFAGVKLLHNDCDAQIKSFCESKDTIPFYDSNAVQLNQAVEDRILEMKAFLAPMAKRKLGEATQNLGRDRILESALADFSTDTMRMLTESDIAFMNTGGIREDIAAGPITYESLYEVLPFGNHGVVINEMSFKTVMQLLTRSVQTCGAYGALMQSGLVVNYTRNCAANKETGVDLEAKVLKVSTINGEVLFDSVTGEKTDENRLFKVSTLDFLASGGAGYNEFKGHKIDRDIGIIREAMADYLEKNPAKLDGKIDKRWNLITE